MPSPVRILPIPALALALALALSPLAAAAQDAASPAPARVITVVGEGRADAKPDLAIVSLGVSHQAKTAGEAMALMSGGMTTVLAELTQAGISPSDIQTGQLTLEAAYDYNTASAYPPVTGFIATQVVDVRVREIANVGPILDAVTAEGANRLNGVVFALTDQDAALAEARGAAVEDARARAEFYAEAAGVSVGDLLQIVENGGYTQPQPMFDARFAAEQAASTPVSPGQLSVIATVTMTYAIDG